MIAAANFFLALIEQLDTLLMVHKARYFNHRIILSMSLY
jgi:hypothetical protein